MQFRMLLFTIHSDQNRYTKYYNLLKLVYSNVQLSKLFNIMTSLLSRPPFSSPKQLISIEYCRDGERLATFSLSVVKF